MIFQKNFSTRENEILESDKETKFMTKEVVPQVEEGRATNQANKKRENLWRIRCPEESLAGLC